MSLLSTNVGLQVVPNNTLFTPDMLSAVHKGWFWYQSCVRMASIKLETKPFRFFGENKTYMYTLILIKNLKLIEK